MQGKCPLLPMQPMPAGADDRSKKIMSDQSSATYRSCINLQGEWLLTQISRARHYSTLMCLRRNGTR